MRQPFSVNVFIATFDGGSPRFLLLQKRARVDLGLESFWQGVTGGIEDDESKEEAAIREVYEETQIAGMQLFDVNFTCRFSTEKEWTYMYNMKYLEIVEHTFLGLIPEKRPPTLSGEHTAYRWLKYSEAHSLLKLEHNKLALEKCSDFLITSNLCLDTSG